MKKYFPKSINLPLAVLAILLVLPLPLCQLLPTPIYVGAQEGQEVIELRGQNSKTFYLGSSQYRAIITGPLHYQDAYGNWQNINNEIIPATAPWNWQMTSDAYSAKFLNSFTAGQVLKWEAFGQSVAFQPMAIEWINDINQIQQISMPQNTAVLVTNANSQLIEGIDTGYKQGTIRWDDAYGEGRHFWWTCDTNRLSKTLELESAPPAPQQYIIDGGNPVFRLNFIFAPSSGLNIYVDGTLWDKSTRVQTFSSIDFKSSSQLLWSFIPVRIWDSAGNETTVAIELRRSGQNLYVSARVPYVWLQAATYPVFIDPTLTVQPPSKDNYLDSYSPDTNKGTATSLQVSRSLMGDIWFRSLVEFPVVWGTDIPSGASITTATFNLYIFDLFGADTYTVSRLLRLDWSETQSTWNIYKTGSSWTTAGCGSNGNDYTSTDEVSIEISSGTWQTWTITNQVKWAQTNNKNIGCRIACTETVWVYIYAYSKEYALDTSLRPKLVIVYTLASAPTVTTSAATSVEATTARLNGDVTATGGENPTVTVYWGDNDGGTNPVSWDFNSAPTSPAQPQGVASFYKNVNSLSTGTLYYFNAKGTNSGGTGWGTTRSFTTKPAAPTNVAATDGVYTNKVVVTWTKSTGATGYKVYEGDNLLDTLGDVATYDDSAAPAPTITAGTASSSDGTSTAYVTLSISGELVTNGASRTYKVKAFNGGGDSPDSNTDTGYIGHGDLTYQWQRSATDSDSNYSNISGGISDPYDDMDGVIEPDGRYYKCLVSASGAVSQNSTSDRGYMLSFPDITNLPGSISFGILSVNTTSNTAINYFTVENTGNCPVDITIQGTDMAGGGFTWTLSDNATPGDMIYGLKAGLDDVDDTFDVIVKKNSPYNTLLSNLAENVTQGWGLKFYMPTLVSIYNAQQMSGTITLVASISS